MHFQYIPFVSPSLFWTTFSIRMSYLIFAYKLLKSCRQPLDDILLHKWGISPELFDVWTWTICLSVVRPLLLVVRGILLSWGWVERFDIISFKESYIYWYLKRQDNLRKNVLTGHHKSPCSYLFGTLLKIVLEHPAALICSTKAKCRTSIFGRNWNKT